MSLGRAVVLIDNGYISAILRDEYSSTRIDYLKLSELICTGYHRLRTYVYDCMPYKSDPPTQIQQALFSGKQRFFDALRKLPAFELRFGKQRPRGHSFVQKGVDVWLSVDMVRLSAKGQVQKIFLIAGDADYVPAVQTAKNEGVSVKLIHSGNFSVLPNGKQLPKFSNELWQICDERQPISQQLIDRWKF